MSIGNRRTKSPDTPFRRDRLLSLSKHRLTSTRFCSFERHILMDGGKGIFYPDLEGFKNLQGLTMGNFFRTGRDLSLREGLVERLQSW